jgi:steroid delta-isomerase-like uncharacterized protein
MSEENKAIVRRFWEIVNQKIVPEKDLDAFEEFYASDYVWHIPGQDIQGLEQAKQVEGMYVNAFPDLQFTVEDVVAEGDKVVSRCTLRGTHRGETESLGPPTGRAVELEGIFMHRIEGGKMVEGWDRYDNLSFMQQLGLVPEQ